MSGARRVLRSSALLWSSALLMSLAAGCNGRIGEAGLGDALGVGGAGDGAGGGGGDDTPVGLVDPSGGGDGDEDCTVAEPTRPLLRRLSRWEYDHSVEDLLGIASRHGQGFVADTTVEGFDNQADALVVTPLLADQLHSAAEAVVTELGDAGLERLLPCALAAGDASCAQGFVEQLGKRMFRRPLTASEVDRYVALHAVGASDEGFAGGVRLVLGTLLQSPNFLYRTELGSDAGDGTRALDSYEIATELAYLVTGSTPDAELLAAADADALVRADEREAQVERLLQTPRGQAQLVRFVNAWLELERLSSVPKDAAQFAGFTPELRVSMAGEVERFVGHVVGDGEGTLSELLSAPLAFADAPLAAHYGLSAPAGGEFQRYDAPDPARHGLLTLAAVMTTHARPDGSSPVHRGKLVRERVLCQKLAPPPPGIVVQPPPVDPSLSTRERYSAHSAEQPCQGCHRLIDPIGLGFEHLDAVGRYRAQEAGAAIDASGEIIDSRATDATFDGTAELSALLAGSDEVADCVALQWFRFAYAMEPEGGSACLLRDVQASFRDAGGSLHSLVKALAGSVQITRRLTAVGEGGGSGEGGASGASGEGGVGGAAGGTGGAGGDAEPDAGPPEPGQEGVTHQVTTDSSWEAGRCDSVTVTNSGAAAVTWSVTLPIDGTLNDHWNCSPSADSGDVRFSGAAQNGTLEPAASTSFGYCLLY